MKYSDADVQIAFQAGAWVHFPLQYAGVAVKGESFISCVANWRAILV